MPDTNHIHTLADAIAALDAHDGLSNTQRRDMISAINRVTTYLNRSPADLPSNAPDLRKVLAKIHPAQAGISAKSFANVKSDLAKALQTVRHLPPKEPKAEPTDGWQDFLSHCTAKHQRWFLSRLVTYFCNRDIEPGDVTDAIMMEFQMHLDDRLLGKDPAKLCKELAQAWNGIVKRNDLPLVQLSYEKGRQYRSRPLSIYPETLQKEIDTYLGKLAHADRFDDDGPAKALRPTSIRNIKAQITQFLDALVCAGEDPSNFHSLKDVVTSDNMQAGFEAIMVRRGLDEIPPSLHNIACTLAAIARHHLCLKPKKLKRIINIKKKVAYDPKGMTAKNAKRLAQFDDWQNVVRLLCLPADLMDRALDNPSSRKSSLLAMHAAAMAILLACPMRVKNLSGLDIDRHLIPHRNGTHTTYTLRIEGREVKNEEPIDVELSHSNSQLLHRYIIKFRPLVSQGNGSALFPKEGSSAPRDPSNFSGDLKALIYRETGLHVNAHLFRHIAAFLYLKERPGDFETVRRLLKHKRLQTTMDFYAALSGKWSFEQYDKVVLGKWGRGDG